MVLASIATKILYTILLVLILGGGSLLIAGWVKRLLRFRGDKSHSLNLVNNGNCPSHYHLSARSTRSDLTFTYLFNNIPLAPVLEEFEEDEVLVALEPQDNDPALARRSDNPQLKPTPRPVKPAGPVKAGKSVAAKSGMAASFMGTLGGILPGRLGAGLKEKAGTARDVQLKSARATQAPQLTVNKIDAVKGASAKLGVTTSTNGKTSQSGRAGGLAAASSPDKQIVLPVQDGKVEKMNTSALRDTGLVQTGELNPGEALSFTLHIGTTAKRYPSGSFIYVIQSQQIPVNGSFGVPAPVSKSGTVYFKPVSIWRYWVPKISSSLVLLLALFGIIYGLTYLWG